MRSSAWRTERLRGRATPSSEPVCGILFLLGREWYHARRVGPCYEHGLPFGELPIDLSGELFPCLNVSLRTPSHGVTQGAYHAARGSSAHDQKAQGRHICRSELDVQLGGCEVAEEALRGELR